MSLSAKEILSIRHNAYIGEQNVGDYKYQAARGDENLPLFAVDEQAFSRKYDPKRIFASYDIALPSSQEGLTVSDQIDLRVNKGYVVNVLDIGCGAGSFLLGKKRKYGNRIQAIGITAKDFSRAYYYDDKQKLTFHDVLNKFGVSVFEGDAHNLFSELNKNCDRMDFDVVTAQGSLHYMGDPLCVVKQAYRLLRKKNLGYLPGVMYAGLDGHSAFGIVKNIQSKLIQDGYSIQVIDQIYKEVPNSNKRQSSGGIILEKTNKDRLLLPIRYSGTVIENESTVGQNTPCVVYEAIV